MACSGQVLNRDQLYQYAHQAGFQGHAADIIVAIAFAESGGCTTAVNPNDPYGGSFGVLQINGSHFLSGTTTKTCAFDPLCSFQFAYNLSGAGNKFTDWGTFTNGSYLQFLQNIGGASTGASPSQPTATLASTTANVDPIAAIGNFFNSIQAFTSWVANPLRVLKLVMGLLMILLGLVFTFLSAPRVQQAAGFFIKTAARG